MGFVSQKLTRIVKVAHHTFEWFLQSVESDFYIISRYERWFDAQEEYQPIKKNKNKKINKLKEKMIRIF